jgi:hypothetical protein
MASASSRGTFMPRQLFLTALLALLVPATAAAQSYRCVGKDGKKYYGQSLPPQCVGQSVEQLNASGRVVKKFDAQASADERARAEAEESERKKREVISKEEGRRDRALLATYSSEAEIEVSRKRALGGNVTQIREIEGKIAGLRKRKAANENVETELKVEENLLDVKKKEAEQINHRYDDDKKRFLELTRKGK